MYAIIVNPFQIEYIVSMILHALLSLAFADVTASTAEVQNTISKFNTGAHFKLPTLTPAQLVELQQGNVVSILDDSAGVDAPRRAVGFMLSEVSQKQLWLACQDPHAVLNSSTKELRTKINADQSAHWYGFMDLPWPFSDRHWMVKSWNTTSLAKQSNNQLWEHPWDLLPNGATEIKPFIDSGKLSGVTLDLVNEAVYTPVSNGAWAVATVNSHTRLIVYHATTVVGGSIPESTAVRYTVITLEDMMTDMEKRAIEWVPKHYVSGHVGVLGGDNEIIPTF